jgi:putative ABC transport system permease protein
MTGGPWSLALRNISRNRRRSLLTGAVVVFGFAAFALAGGFMQQSFEGLREATIRNGTGHLQFADPAFFTESGDTTLEHGLADSERARALLAEDPEVLEVLPRIDFVGLASNGAKSVPFLGTGVDPAPEARTMDTPKDLAAGRWLENAEERGAVLGAGLARSLDVKAGDSITLLATSRDGVLNAVDATVTGIADVPIKELDDRYVATTLGLATELLAASGTVSKLTVVLREPADAEGARPRLLNRLEGAGFHVTGKTWEELGLFYRQVRMLYVAIFGFMGIVLVVVVLLAAANTMMMAAAERTREIGTLRALGTRPSAILSMFLAEGFLLACVSCVAGALFALLVRLALNSSGLELTPPPGASHGAPLHVKVYLLAYAAGAISMVLTLLVASWIPARRAARMAIVEALAHV